MKDRDLIRTIADRTGLSPAVVRQVLRSLTTEITEAIARKDSVTINAFGVFRPTAGRAIRLRTFTRVRTHIESSRQHDHFNRQASKQEPQGPRG